ncbi:MAG: tRNA (adenosine(37)-N6)-threonylcarbamoyltransferase complex dimerization subunit type 1 TsaB [Endomicrobium sp.]|jgi:tRNA threonylcarbamoyladenosine biosynthesis protein TsaB|nr:tRNA (adenosine(37)-N6)-threonylcarbamoyltransferase complex dimerization subunit type 1 TsaB [Endomicrobium sp.]
MKILAIETSGEIFNFALNECEKNIASIYYNRKNTCSEIIITAIEKLLIDTKNTFQNIDKFAISIGPGSFTGIRVGMTAVKMLSQILNKPIVPIDTLSILERPFVKIKGIKVIPMIMASKNEIYIKNNKKIIIKNIDLFIKSIKKYKNKLLLIGNAAIFYRKKIIKNFGVNSVAISYNIHTPQACLLAEIAYKSLGSTNYSKINPLYTHNTFFKQKQ